MKTSELKDLALDWAVTKCEGYDHEVTSSEWGVWGWATNWSQGGPIIEREIISVAREFSSFTKGFEWAAWTPAPIRDDAESFGYGPTPLVAAMRCYVASKLGDTIDIPEELT
jgi:hypothetical protein